MPYFLVFNLCKKSVQIFAKILSCFILISERVLTLSCSCPVLACPGLSCCGVEAAGLSVCPGGEEERKPPVPPLTLQSSPVQSSDCLSVTNRSRHLQNDTGAPTDLTQTGLVFLFSVLLKKFGGKLLPVKTIRTFTRSSFLKWAEIIEIKLLNEDYATHSSNSNMKHHNPHFCFLLLVLGKYIYCHCGPLGDEYEYRALPL